MNQLIVSSVGWIIALILTFGFLTFGRSYIYNLGLDQGRRLQLQEDVINVEKSNLAVKPASLVDTVNGVIKKATATEIEVETADIAPNPLLGSYPSKRVIKLDSRTIIARRVIETGPAGYAGSKEVKANLSDLLVGRQVQIISRQKGIGYETTILAEKIVLN